VPRALWPPNSTNAYTRREGSAHPLCRRLAIDSTGAEIGGWGEPKAEASVYLRELRGPQFRLRPATSVPDRDGVSSGEQCQLTSYVLRVYRGEVCALRWSDIDFAGRSVRFEEAVVTAKGGAVVRGPKTRASIRTVALDDDSLAT
jgi:hypothetical protein